MVTVHGNYAQFRFYRPGAGYVCLVGDFNGWRQGQLMMVPDGQGYWLATMKLPAGSFRFRYNSDGQWFTDYAAFGIEYVPGHINSIVRIGSLDGDGRPQDDKADSVIALGDYQADRRVSAKAG